MKMTDANPIPQVVIIGGGFGGLETAKALDQAPVDVLMLDKHNYHTFQPLLYQVATGSLEAESIAFSLRKNYDRQKNFRFRIAEVTQVLPTKNQVETNIGRFDYDYLVLATGSTTNFFGDKGVEKFARPMKSIPEALNLRYSILHHFEQAVLKETEAEREPYLNFVLVGAGPTGVELAGALAELRNHVLTKDYPELEKRDMKVYLVDFLPKALSSFSSEASKAAERYLKKMGVELLLGEKVAGYDGTTLKLEGAKAIHSKNVVWSAGVSGFFPEELHKGTVEKGSR